jgi:hypothetical protein
VEGEELAAVVEVPMGARVEGALARPDVVAVLVPGPPLVVVAVVIAVVVVVSPRHFANGFFTCGVDKSAHSNVVSGIHSGRNSSLLFTHNRSIHSSSHQMTLCRFKKIYTFMTNLYLQLPYKFSPMNKKNLIYNPNTFFYGGKKLILK